MFLFFVGELAPTDAAENVHKLTLDSRNELAAGAACVGGPMEDELTLSSFNRRWSYLTSFDWLYSQAPDTLLFSAACTPVHYVVRPLFTTTRCVMPTSMCIAAIPFKYWHGSIEFKFEIVCSSFNRGRLRVVYDPYGIPTPAYFNQNYQEILDIEAGADTMMTVNWAVRTPAQEVSVIDLSTANYSVGSTGIDPDSQKHNGAIYIYVLNNLSVPNMAMPASDSSVYVNVYVRAGEDMQYFTPTSDCLKTLSVTLPFTPSSNEYTLQPLADDGKPGDEAVQVSVGSPSNDNRLSMILFGESVASFRALMKRYCDYIPWYWSGGGTNVFTYVLNSRRFPLFPGNDASGLFTITNLLTTGTYPGNMYTLNPMMLLAPMFAGYRGSIRYKYVFEPWSNNSIGPSMTIKVTRDQGVVSSYTTTDLGAGSNLKLATAIRSGKQAWQGSFMTQTGFNPVFEIEDPYYERLKFISPKALVDNTYVDLGGHSLTVPAKSQAAATGVNQFMSKSFVAAGEDFNYFFYTGPVLLWTSSYY